MDKEMFLAILNLESQRLTSEIRRLQLYIARNTGEVKPQDCPLQWNMELLKILQFERSKECCPVCGDYKNHR